MKFKKKLYLSGIAVLSLIGLYFVITNLIINDDGQAYVFTLPDLALLDQSLYTCYFKSSGYFNGEFGKSIDYNSQFFTKKPSLVTNELVNRQNFDDTINGFVIYPKLKCDYLSDQKNSNPSSKFLLKVDPRTKLTLNMIGTDKSGKALPIQPITKSASFNNILCDYCGDAGLAVFNIPASDIDKLYESAVSPYTKDITFSVSGEIYLRNDFGYEYYMKIDRPVTFTSFFTVNKPLAVTQPTTQNIPSVEKITQTISDARLDTLETKLNTATSQGRQISVYSTVKPWSDSNPIPKMELHYCGSSNSCTYQSQILVTFDKKVGTDGLFIGRYTLAENSKDGLYQIKVSTTSSSTVATRNFEVKNLTPTPPAATPTPTTNTKVFTGKLYLPYSLVLDSKTVTKNIKDQSGTDITLNPLSVLSDDGSERFIKIVIEPVAIIDQGTSTLSVGSSNLKYSGIMTLQDTFKEVLIQGISSSSTKMTKDSSGYIHFPPFEITSSMIESTVKNSPDIQQNVKVPLYISARIDGSFDLIEQSSGKKYQAVLQNNNGVQFFVNYDPQIIDPTKPTNQEPCQGLSGKEIILCKARIFVTDPNECGSMNSAVNVGNSMYVCIDPAATGGYCEGLTSLQCLEKAKEQPKNNQCNDLFGLFDCQPEQPKTNTNSPTTTSNNPPKTNTGGIVLCEGDLNACLEKAKNAVNSGTSSLSGLGIDTNQILIILGLIVLLGIIIAIIKSRKK